LTARIPAKIRHLIGTRGSIVRDSVAPPHAVRWVDGERLLITGADTLSGPARTQARTIVQRTGQLMYELSTLYPDVSGIQPEYGWDAAYGRTNDGLPFIGPHRNYPHHLFALAIRARVRPVRTSPAASCSATIWGKPIRPTSTSPSRAMSVDLLVFGPHPDDIEIGCGASVARHAALGLRVGLCDLTAGEMSSNGTVDERLREAEAASTVLGAAWRENLRWPDRRIGKEPAHLEHAVTFIRKHRPRVVARPTGPIGTPTTGRRAP